MTIFPFVSAAAFRALLGALAFHVRDHFFVKSKKSLFEALVLLGIGFAVREIVDTNWKFGKPGQSTEIAMAAIFPFQVEWVRPTRLHLDSRRLVVTPGPSPLSGPADGGAAIRARICGDVICFRPDWGT